MVRETEFNEKGKDYKNTANLNEYFEKINAHQFPKIETNKIDSSKRKILMGLRLREGISIKAFKKAGFTHTSEKVHKGFNSILMTFEEAKENEKRNHD